ncbi:MAG: hypothetical protein IBJ00_02910 [Alphaproteobacteria bacterium]|nr:hypothetical protein [Alphaproteobacteria bacterium]
MSLIFLIFCTLYFQPLLQADSLQASTSMSKTAESYLKEALQIIKTHALTSKNVDWDQCEKEAFYCARHAQSPTQTYPAIHFILEKLGDNHSKFITKQAYANMQEEASINTSFNQIQGKLLAGKIGYILIPSFNGQGEEAKKYALKISSLIQVLAQHNPFGWIIDLRQNRGGNMYPMLLAVAPLLNEGILGYFISASGKESTWSYRNSSIYENHTIRVNLPPNNVKKISPRTPVALLIGPHTASSAEAVAITFKTQPETRFFGQKTAGLATSNQLFELKDGAKLLLTVEFFADLNKNIYKDGILPDEVITQHQKGNDPALQAALKWLLSTFS